MDLIFFYCLVTLIFLNAGASTLVLIPRVVDMKFRLMALLSLFLTCISFTAFINASWPILIFGFGLYCFGLLMDCMFYSDKASKSRHSFIGMYVFAALGSVLALITGINIIFLLSYIGYWSFSYLLNRGLINAISISSNKEL